MILLEKNEPCLTDPNLCCVVGGEYSDDDLVDLYHVSNPTQIVSFHALYIKEGRFPE